MRRFVNLSSLGARAQQQQQPSCGNSAASQSGLLGSPATRLLRSSSSAAAAAQQQQHQLPTLSLRKLSSWGGSGSSLSGSSGKSGEPESGRQTKKRRSPISSAGVVSKSTWTGSGEGSGERSGGGGGASGSSGQQPARGRSKSNSRGAEGNESRAAGMSSSGRADRTQGGGSSRKTNSGAGNNKSDANNSQTVKHDKDGRRFTLDLGNNQVARIDYKPIGKNKLELYHTEVPSELRGRGIGKALARGAFDCVSASNMKLKLTCSYLADYLERFAEPKHKKLVER